MVRDRSQMHQSKRFRASLFNGKHAWHQRRHVEDINRMFAKIEAEKLVKVMGT